MSIVFTGESKIFQLAAVNPDGYSTKVEQVSVNIPLIEAMIEAGFNMAMEGAKNPDKITPEFKAAFNLSYEQVEQLTNNFIEAMERSGMPWAQQFEAWQTYNRQLQGYCSEKLMMRLQQHMKGQE